MLLSSRQVSLLLAGTTLTSLSERNIRARVTRVVGKDQQWFLRQDRTPPPTNVRIDAPCALGGNGRRVALAAHSRPPWYAENTNLPPGLKAQLQWLTTQSGNDAKMSLHPATWKISLQTARAREKRCTIMQVGTDYLPCA